MADKMMRIAGRTISGIARALRVDDEGFLRTRPADNVVILGETTPNLQVNRGETIQLIGRTNVQEFTELVVTLAWKGSAQTEIRTVFTTGELGTMLDTQVDVDNGSSIKQVVKVTTDTVRYINITNQSDKDLILEKAIVVGLRR